MRRTLSLRLLPLFLFMGIVLNGCLGAPSWSQFHADGPSQGFFGVHSSPASVATWTVEVGPVGFSSPAVASDGTIYVGNLNGDVLAVRSDGTVAWRFATRTLFRQPYIESSPAISPDGNIYVIVNHGADATAKTKGVSTLLSLSQDGQVRWTYFFPLNAVTMSSPKLYGAGENLRIFVAGAQPLLVVLNDQGKVVATQQWACPHDVEGGGLDWNTALALFTGGLSLIFDPLMFELRGFDVSLIDPTPAVVDYPRFVDPGMVSVIAPVNACGIHAFTWSLSAQTLTPLWAVPNARAFFSSAAVSQQGRVVIGRDDGHVLAYDVRSGAQLWDYDAGEEVVGTPAFFLGQLQSYVISATHLHYLETDGALTHKVTLARSYSSPAVTWDGIYLSSDTGLETHQFDLSFDAVDRDARGGASSPAVGKDGTIYAVSTDQKLRAYRPSQ
jgi:FOG: WD40-like repeat